MLKDLSVRTRIVASFVAILVTLVLIGLVSFVRLSKIEEEASLIQSDSVPLYQSARIVSAIGNGLAAMQSAAHADITGGRDAEPDLQSSRAEINTLAADYDRSIPGADDRRLLSALTTYRVAQQRAEEALRNKEPSDVIVTSLKNVQSAHASFTDVANAVMDQNNGEVIAALDKTRDSIGQIKTGLVVGCICAVGIALVSGYILLRAITRPLTRLVAAMDVVRSGDFTARIGAARLDEFGTLSRGFDRMADEVMTLVGNVQMSGIQVSTSMNEIAATSKQQQATATEIAATTTEVGATSKEISATSRHLVSTMNEVSTVAERTAVLAGEGQVGLARMDGIMRQVMAAAGSINAKLGVLNEKAGNINQVVTTITRVADQTNLLSLNAAIEAEKAGEYGRGFGVVASEIRRLADQTAVATYDIEQMVKEIESAVSAGVMGMDKFSEEVRRGMQEMEQVGSQLTQIIQQVQTLVPRFESVNEGMQAQAVGAEQISDALVQLTEAAQQTVESLRQSTTAIDDLNEVSGTLRNSVSRFKLEAA